MRSDGMAGSMVVAAVAVAGALAFVSCGDTGGEIDISPEDFVVNSDSCNPDANCLALGVDTPVQVNQTGRFVARLRDSTGTPLRAVQLCFAFSPAGPTIADPSSATNNCAFTSSNGQVSGSYSSTTEGSFEFFVSAPSGYSLTTQRTVVFTAAQCTVDANCATNQFCGPNPQNACGDPVGTCIPLKSLNECCTAGTQCASGTCTSMRCA